MGGAGDAVVYRPAPSLQTRAGVDWGHYVVVVAHDGAEFRVSRKAARLSTYLREAVGEEQLHERDDGDVTAGDVPSGSMAQDAIIVPIPHVPADTLRHVVAYLEHYRTRVPRLIPRPLRKPIEDVVEKWDAALIFTDLVLDHDLGEDRDHEELVAVLMAAGFLGIDPLVDLASAALASIIRPKSVEDLRDMFDIENDLSADEEARLVRDTIWGDPKGEDDF